MFDQRGWVRTGLVEGPVPAVPSSLVASELLVWADRAPVNGAWLDAITSIDPAALSGGDRIALVRAWERLRRGVDAAFATAVGSIAERPCRPEPGDPSCSGGRACAHDWSVEDTGLALGVGRQTAGTLLAHSRELTRRLPGLLAEVTDGRAPFSAARKAAERTVGLADPLVASVAADITGAAAGKTPGAFDRHVAAVIDRHRDPAETAAAHQAKRRAETGIRPMQPMADGIAGATIYGPAEKIAALFGWARQFTRANRHPDDPRTVGQRRLDALLTAILDPAPLAATTPTVATPGADRPGASGGTPAGTPTTGGAPTGGAPDREAPRQRVALQLVLAASTLLDHDNEPGWLDGHGPLAAPLARALAVHPDTIARLLTHPVTGHLLDLTPDTRVPTSALERYVRARDGGCTGPACGGSSRTAELDHIHRHADGGPTTRANLHTPCKRDHRKRHPGGWTVRRDPQGSTTWADPHGNNYLTHPIRYPGQPISPAPTRPSNIDSEPINAGPIDLGWPPPPGHTKVRVVHGRPHTRSRPHRGTPEITWPAYARPATARQHNNWPPNTQPKATPDHDDHDDYDDLELRTPPHQAEPPEPPCPF